MTSCKGGVVVGDEAPELSSQYSARMLSKNVTPEVQAPYSGLVEDYSNNKEVSW